MNIVLNKKVHETSKGDETFLEPYAGEVMDTIQKQRLIQPLKPEIRLKDESKVEEDPEGVTW
ncbi:hypothetical protein F2Q68_00012727 [Brassica cretica]|uniref:Uncharacterized protein n=1 Tax=Brassica cretica TaxID=69181 RepID=A0A8S9HGB6_BRACR|nr:hypothetical protein F2Q68_00012727 [Brassica cretica]